MNTEYNSKLIAELYSITEESKMMELLKEIEEINDPIFLYPIYEIYKKNKNEYYSHYFLITLNKLNSNELIPIAVEIGNNPETDSVGCKYVVEIFKKRKYYKEDAINIALTSLDLSISEISDGDGDGYSLDTIIPYLKDAGLISKLENRLQLIYSDDRFDIDDRKYAFGQWLEINPKKHLQYIIENFDNIKCIEGYDTMVAKTISTWSGPKTEKLEKVILEKGGIKAKAIIQRAQKKRKEKVKKGENLKQQTVKENYSNADIVEQISILREKINSITSIHKHIDFPIFPQNEVICLQLKTATDEATLIKACVDLRDMIQNLNDNLKNHSIDEETIKTLLPNTAEHDFNKSINKLFLFLHSKKFKIKSDLFGLRELNQILSLLGAHSKSKEKELRKKLQEAKLYDSYKKEDWGFLHQNLLKKYKDSLGKLFKVINETD